MNKISKAELLNIDLKTLKGANVIFDGEPLAVVMSMEYYSKIEALLRELKKQLQSKSAVIKNKTIDGGKF